jgi:glycosyltransferase involved in cell wall biosynthesis
VNDVFFFNTWYRGHNNMRYAELLPRLDRVDARVLTFPRQRLARAALERGWRLAKPRLEPQLLRRLERRYPYAFVTDVPQLSSLRVPAVADVDDPYFSDAEVEGLKRAAAYVVTAEHAARRFEAAGVETPWHVVPQGVGLDELDGERTLELGRSLRRGGDDLLVGYVAAYLLLPGDRGGGNPLYDVSHLLELWQEIEPRAPRARLLLVGSPSAQLRERVAGRDHVILTGRVPQADVLSYIANFDVALYPRTADQGIRAVKTAEYLGVGAPIVSYDYEVVADVREAGAGILVRDAREFADAVVHLVDHAAMRAELAAKAHAAGAARDWRVLAERYAAILDEHLPRKGLVH